jgi:hypothetical protein
MMYFVVLAVIAAYILGLALLERWVSFLPLQLALGMFGILSAFTILGGAVYERRNELGLNTLASPERTADLERRAELRRSERIVMEAYGLMRVGAHVKAWAMLQDWLRSRANSPDDYRWLCERVSTWGDPRYLNRLTEEYVERLIILKQDGRALDVVAHRLDEDPSFRPKSASATMHIAQLAAHGGGASRVARALLGDFGRRFPDDPAVAAADALVKQLSK